jgi:FkbM family methyltransferase
MSLLGALTTKTSIAAARALRPFPGLLGAYLPKAYDYLDWRWSDITTCKTEFGAKMRCRLNDLIQRKIAYFGVWEPNLTAYFRKCLKPGDIVLDVGANIGYFTLLGSSLVGPTGRVISIEAAPQIFRLLSDNIALNRATNVRAVNCAAAYEEGEMSIYSADDANIGSSSTIPVEGNKLTGTVKALPLHDIATREELARVRLIKIDIEGAEQPVVRSILENLSLYSSDCEIALEVAVASNGIFADMAAHGFKAYELQNDYSDKFYMSRITSSPSPFSGTVTKLTDFIFSRSTPVGN